MRHAEQFDALRTLLPQLRERRGFGTVKAWSAGCASGEEAYSLAATLSKMVGSAFELTAWDINPDAIARAHQGEYRPWSLRGVDAQTTEGWLEPSPCGVRVQPWLRDRLRFQVGNLHLDAYPSDLDIIFCRNVLLYFRPEAAARVLMRMSDSLRPGGVLFLGHYDPRPEPIAGLLAGTLGTAVFYQKPLYRDQRLVQSVPVAAVGIPSLVPRAPASLRPGPVPIADRAQRMERVRLLANERRTDQALALLSDLTKSSPLLPEVHILTALVAEDAGDMRLMLEAARRACFLVPDQPGPNYFLSVAFVRNGELRRAALHRRIAAAALRTANQQTQVVELSEGLTVGQLRRLIGAIAR